MKHNPKKLLGWLGLAMFAGLALFCIYYRLRHVDHTEARVFLDMWPFAVLAFCGFGLFAWTEKS